MNRYYICRRLGTGVGGANDPYRSELREWIDINFPDFRVFKQQIITDTFPWCLMKYDLPQNVHDAAIAAVQCFVLPQRALDDVPTVPQRNAIATRLGTMGLSSAWMTATTNFRDVLKYIAHSAELSKWAIININNNFDIQTQTLGDLPLEAINNIANRFAGLGFTGTIPATTPLWRLIRIARTMPDETTPRLFADGKKLFYTDEELT